MSIAEKLQTIAENEQLVYDTGYNLGKAVGERYILNIITDYGNKSRYDYFYYGFQTATELPTVNTSNSTSFGNMYRDCKALKSIPPMDTSKGTNFNSMFLGCKAITTIPPLDFSKATDASQVFQNCSNLITLPPIILSEITSTTNMFYGCFKLVTIEKVNFSKATSLNSAFFACNDLENVVFEGSIICNISFSYSTKLTHDSLMSIINALCDNSSGTSTLTLTIGSSNTAKLTEEELLIAENKGWVVK